MDIVFVAGVALVSQTDALRGLLTKDLGLPLKGENPDDAYIHSESIDGLKHFGVWPLAMAAEACFGKPEWPSHLPKPQLSIEFELRDADAVAAAEKELRAKGHELLHATRLEPWGQTVCRLLSAEGAIIGLSFAPWLHKA